MRFVAMFTLLAVLAGGLGIAYIVYKQMDTGTVVITAEAHLEQTETGARCGDTTFTVDARTIGAWALRVDKGVIISGSVIVDGNEDYDIALRIYSPTNRPVFFEGNRMHEIEFELAPAVRGDYTFEFDNRHSTFTEKDLIVSVCLA